ncbi:MAG TPA: 5-dehydro-4-deoxy-D-glucuronate isomerase [Candidatus Binatia bacterium]|jgi:4-deoxy-L-threo-5-hexosulose-uronate ketol-isomerase|nr:5-dehydro-4-deoxy-D-glucuronate isomerase [Candidatus Binatia bacterium]
MQARLSPSQTEYQKLGTEELRAAFLVDALFPPGRIELVYSDADRAIIGSAVPGSSPLKLTADAELRAAYFCERRELGILNIGGSGSVEVDGKRFDLAKLDCLYVGRGSQSLTFANRDGANPAAFYLLSYPAHSAYPTTLARRPDAAVVELGTSADANRRTIYKYIHTAGIKSCQLVMGFTQLHEGAVWNTMPPHTHTRRSEVYMYFDLGPVRRVMHFMGTPQQTRHLVMAERQVVISPSWSIHCGCGTGAYTFCWGMGGENQTFEDMDPAPLEQLR